MTQWQPIETAPRDGTMVDLWVPYYGDAFRAADCLWLHPDNQWWMSGKGRFLPYSPTHWMPLPEAPK